MSEEKPKKKSNIGALIFPLLQLLTSCAVVGFVVYANFLFKRKPIVEHEEVKKIDDLITIEKTEAETVTYLIETFTANLSHSPEEPSEDPLRNRGTEGKPHMLTTEIILEIKDKESLDKITALSGVIKDELLSIFAKKNWIELSDVVGRFTLKNDIIDQVNTLVNSPVVLGVHFTEFTVQ